MTTFFIIFKLHLANCSSILICLVCMSRHLWTPAISHISVWIQYKYNEYVCIQTADCVNEAVCRNQFTSERLINLHQQWYVVEQVDERKDPKYSSTLLSVSQATQQTQTTVTTHINYTAFSSQEDVWPRDMHHSWQTEIEWLSDFTFSYPVTLTLTFSILAVW